MALTHQYHEIDYLLIGHITKDLTSDGPLIGGTVTYAGLTAQRLGLRVGIVSSWGNDISLDSLESLPLAGYPDDRTTTYENIETPQGRMQIIHSIAADLDYHHIPDPWRSAAITHIAPLNQEVRPSIITRLQSDSIFITPQGWLRAWDERGNVSSADWPEGPFILSHAAGAAVSAHDLGNEVSRIEEMASSCRLLAVTESEFGARIYYQGEIRHFSAPPVTPVDTTGAGDIFAAVFFIHYFRTGDPWEAGQLATTLASYSTVRVGLDSVPTVQEIKTALAKIVAY